jgi:hypothetical protein
MTANSSRVAAAQPTDIEPLISVMVLAFAADPVARWMYRDPERYLAYFGRFIRAFAGKAFSTGTASRIDGNLGGALWLPPGVKPDEDAIAAILDESVPPEVMADVITMFGEMAAYHPRDPHCFGSKNSETDYDTKILGQTDRSITLDRDSIQAYRAKSFYLLVSSRPNDALRAANAARNRPKFSVSAGDAKYR